MHAGTTVACDMRSPQICTRGRLPAGTDWLTTISNIGKSGVAQYLSFTSTFIMLPDLYIFLGSRVGRAVATESSDAASSRRLRHHDSGVVPPAGATRYCPAAPSHVCLQLIFGRMPGGRPLSMARAVATHFRHCDILTLNSSAAQVLPASSVEAVARGVLIRGSVAAV